MHYQHRNRALKSKFILELLPKHTKNKGQCNKNRKKNLPIFVTLKFLKKYHFQTYFNEIRKVWIENLLILVIKSMKISFLNIKTTTTKFFFLLLLFCKKKLYIIVTLAID